MTTLFVLIDYDNLLDFKGTKSIDTLIRHVESKIPDRFLQDIIHLEMRLYGGWASGGRSTHQAQKLFHEISGKYPSSTVRLSSDGRSESRIINITLATASLFFPKEHLSDTFMLNRSVRNIKIDQSGWQSCSAPTNCSLSTVERFITSGHCGANSCGVAMTHLIKQNEQKQVDTLIVADMAELSLRQKTQRIVLVSSDADMWPGILLSLSAETEVCHIHTKPGQRTHRNLLSNISRISSRYFEVSV